MEQEQTPERRRRPLREYIKLFFCGAIMGAADVVPGVSGGTMAFILGIYNELLDSIREFLSPRTVKMVLKFRVGEMYRTLPWPFLLALALGILGAIVLFATPIKWMLENRLVLILSFFFGLVLGSAATVLRQVEKWDAWRIAALILGAAAGFLIVGLPVLASPPAGKWYLVLCGAVAICAMILPGISGSFILLLMGRYDYVLNAVHEIKTRTNLSANLLTLALFCCGIVVGIAFFVRLLSWLLKKYHDLTVAVLIGFMLGSLRKVWPWKANDVLNNANVMPAFDSGLLTAIGLVLAGFFLVLVIEFAARKIESRQQEKC